MSEPYYRDEAVTLWHGDCREVLPALGLTADLALADPPYGETSLPWDRWPEGWLQAVAEVSDSLWCFGSLRMFLAHGGEFADAGWRLSQDVIWAKPKPGGVAFRDRATARSHETIAHWYRGDWADIHHEQPRTSASGVDKGSVHRGWTGPAWSGARRAHTWVDDGTRALSSVIQCQTMRMRGVHPTEKPSGILEPLIEYGCPPGGLLVDPTAGSASALAVAKSLGRRAVGIEADEAMCEIAARRLSQDVLDFGAPA